MEGKVKSKGKRKIRKIKITKRKSEIKFIEIEIYKKQNLQNYYSKIYKKGFK